MTADYEPAVLALRLRGAIRQDLPELSAVPDEAAAIRYGGGSGWTRKHELGHLLDSATNNRVRFVTAALQGEFTGPTYDGEGWVELGGYADLPWLDLVHLWERTNRLLATVLERIPPDRLDSPCHIGPNSEVSLRFLIDDYILHMKHHLDHILGRDKLTSYPGAAVGV